MKKLLLAAAAMAAMTGAAQAQDWSGLYAGVGLGSASRDTTWTDVDYDWVGYNEVAHDGSADEVAVSLFGGYNWQFGNIVLGAQLDYTYADVSEHDYFCPTGCAPEINLDDDLTWMLSARGNLGYSFGQWLPYITAGYAISDLEHSWFEDGDLPDSWPSIENEDAFVYGAGVQFATHTNWAVGVEALRYDFESETEYNNEELYRMEVETEVDLWRLTLSRGF